MTIRRSSLLRLGLWGGLVLLALRPVEPVERIVDLALSPLRAAAEMTAPLVAWRMRRVEAAAPSLDPALSEVEVLWDELLAEARPTREELTRGRSFVPAEVVGRGEGDRDTLRIRVADTTGLAVGQPVVHRDAYVGRVRELDPRTGALAVDLVTGGDFAVGARRVQADSTAPPVWMTVGGIHSVGGGRGVRQVERLALAVHNPSDRSAAEGAVQVDELLPDIDPFGPLARGFELGELAAAPDGGRLVYADVDYGAGLYHVFVLCPEGARVGARDSLGLAVADDRWRPTRPLSLGDPSPWRGGLVVSTGELGGVEPGAAVIAGLRLVGRVESTSAWSSDVRLVTDPGLVVVAVARIAGSSVPRVLGRLVSLGVDPGGAWIRMRWEAVVDVDLPGTPKDGWLEAELYTGSGEAGLPGGLFLGDALLPVVAGRTGTREAPLVYLRRGESVPSQKLWIRTVEEAAP